MTQSLFISMELGDDDNGFAPCDKILIVSLFNEAARHARDHDINLIIRYDPALVDIAAAHFENKPDNLVIMPAEAPFADIAAQYNPGLILILAGAERALQDYYDSGCQAIPLASTGGAAKALCDRMDQNGTTPPPVLRDFRSGDAMGFDLLHKALATITPRKPRPPIPASSGPSSPGPT